MVVLVVSLVVNFEQYSSENALKILIGRGLLEIFGIVISNNEIHVTLVQGQKYGLESLNKDFGLIFQNKLRIYNGQKVKLKLSDNAIPIFHKLKPI